MIVQKANARKRDWMLATTTSTFTAVPVLASVAIVGGCSGHRFTAIWAIKLWDVVSVIERTSYKGQTWRHSFKEQFWGCAAESLQYRLRQSIFVIVRVAM